MALILWPLINPKCKLSTTLRSIVRLLVRGFTPPRKRPRPCGWSVERMEARIVLSTLTLPIARPRTEVYDAGRQLMYFTNTTTIERFDIQTQTLLAPWNIGGVDLGDGDITPDGQFLYVTEFVAVGGNAIIRKIDLDTGVATAIVVQPNSTSGIYDVIIGANGFGFVTLTNPTPGLTPIYQLNLANDTFSPRPDALGSGPNGQVSYFTYMHRSGDRRLTYFAEEPSPVGHTFLYDALTDSFTAERDQGASSQAKSLNRDSTLIASVITNSNIQIYDTNLQLVTTLAAAGADGPNSFDPARDILYVISQTTDQILAIDTHTWATLFTIPYPENIWNFGRLYADSAPYLFYTADPFVYEYTLPTLINIEDSDGQQNPAANAYVDAAIITEGDSGTKTATMTIALSAPNSQTITISYATADDTASAGSDYQTTSGTVTFLPNQTRNTISIPIIGDTNAEPDEIFNVTLSNPVNAFIFQSVAQVIIKNDDSGVPPSLTDLEPTVTFLENDVNAAGQIIDSNVTFTDPDTPSLNGGNLVVTFTAGGGAQDQLGIRNQGNLAGQIGVSGANVTYGGVPFATFTSNGQLTVSFTSNAATPAAIEALIENVTYRNTSDAPVISRDLSFVVTDGFGTPSKPAATTISITTEDDPPTITAISNQTIAEDTSVLVSFTVGDDQSSNASLLVSVTSSNHNLLPDANAVLGGSGAARNVTLTPLPNQTGSSTITLTVNDGGLITTRTFQLIVNPVDDGPTISQISDQIANEDVATSALPFTVGDIDTPLASLTVSATSSVPTLVLQSGFQFGGSGAARTLKITPAANQTGSSTITVTVSDGTTTASMSFLLTVNPVADAPTISHIPNRNTNEDTPTPALAFTIGDADSPLGSLTVSAATSDPSLVTVSNLVLAGSGTSRTLTVTPQPGVTGIVTITLTVSDGALTSQDSFTLTIVPVDDAPTISHIDGQTIAEDTATLPLDFTIGDSDTPLATLVVTATSSNAALVPNGNLVISGSGANRTITATPIQNATGNTTITVSVSDGNTSTVSSFLLIIFDVNDAPTISDISNLAINEDQSTPAMPFTVADEETATASLVISVTSSNPALVPNANLIIGGGAGGNRTLTVTPLADQSGTALITVSVSDGVSTVQDTFTLTVNAVNDAPTITGLQGQTINEDASTGPLPFTVGDVDSALGNLTVTASSSNQLLVPNGNLILTGIGSVRSIAVSPAANQFGSATITVTVSDGLASVNTSFLLTVSPVNDSPTISDVSDQSTTEDFAMAAIPVTLSDVETSATSLLLTATSSNPALVLNSSILVTGSGATRMVSITPVANQFGTATITLTVSDGTATASDTFVLTVSPVNDAPTISGLNNLTIQEDAVTSSLFVFVNDVESPAESLTLTGTSSNPALVPNANLVFSGTGSERSFVITPLANQSGATTITLTVSDGDKTTTTMFLLTVTEISDAPTISQIPGQTIDEDHPTAALSFTIGDGETPANNLVVTATSSNPALIPVGNIVFGGTGANRTVTVTPVSNQFGFSILTIHVNDGGVTTTTSFVVVVNSVNDAPAITLGSDQVVLEDAAPVIETGWASGIATGPTNESDQQLQIMVTTDHPELFSIPPAISITGTLTYTLAPNISGQATVTVTVQDDGGTANGGANASVQSFEITVTAVDDPLAFYNSQPVRQYVRGRTPFMIDPNLGAHDVDNPNLDFSGGQLVVSIGSGISKKDILSLPKGKKKTLAASEIAAIKTNVFFHGQQIATLQGGKKSVPLQIQLGNDVSEATVNALLKSLTFKARGKQSPNSTRSIHIELHDAANTEHAENVNTIQTQT